MRERTTAVPDRVRPVLVALAALVGTLVRAVPAAAGVALVAYGAWQIYAPAGAVVLGGFLILADRRIP